MATNLGFRDAMNFYVQNIATLDSSVMRLIFFPNLVYYLILQYFGHRKYRVKKSIKVYVCTNEIDLRRPTTD